MGQAALAPPPIRVSVIVPTRNRPAFLREALQSIRALDGPDLDLDLELELLVCDNGGLPETAEIARELGARHLHVARESAGAARNAGIRAATGQYLAFLDDDDLWLPGHLRPQVALLEARPDLEAALGQVITTDSDRNPTSPPWPDQVPADGDLFGLFLDMYPQIGGTVARVGVRDTVGYIDEDLVGDEDWDWHLRLALRHRIGLAAVPGVLFRQRPDGSYDTMQWVRLGFMTRVYLRNLRRARGRLPSPYRLARTYLAHRREYYEYFAGSTGRHLRDGEWLAAVRAAAQAFYCSPPHAVRDVLRGGARREETGDRRQETGAGSGTLAAPPSTISVVICTNRPGSLLDAVTSVLANQEPAFELLVVAQGTDPTWADRELAGPLDDARLRVVHDPGRGLSHARNLGIRESTGDLIVFTDDDCLASPGWVQAHLDVYREHPEAMLVFGAVAAPDWYTLADGMVPTFHPQPVTEADAVPGRIVLGMGANMSLRRTLVDRIGQFDEELGAGAPLPSADDLDYALRAAAAGFCVLADARPVIVHAGGVRARGAESAQLWRRDGFGIGALLAKQLRAGNWSGAAALAGISGRTCRDAAIRIVRLRRPLGLRMAGLLTLGTLSGLARAIRHPLVHSEGGVYLKRRQESVVSSQ